MGVASEVVDVGAGALVVEALVAVEMAGVEKVVVAVEGEVVGLEVVAAVREDASSERPRTHSKAAH